MPPPGTLETGSRAKFPLFLFAQALLEIREDAAEILDVKLQGFDGFAIALTGGVVELRFETREVGLDGIALRLFCVLEVLDLGFELARPLAVAGRLRFFELPFAHFALDAREVAAVGDYQAVFQVGNDEL